MSEADQTVSKSTILITEENLVTIPQKKKESTDEPSEDDFSKKIIYFVVFAVFVLMLTLSLFALKYRNVLLKEMEKYENVIDDHFYLSVLILLICHVVGSLILIPGTLFLMPGGFMFGYHFKGKFYGYIIAIITILHINIISGFAAFLNSKKCLKSTVRKHLIDKSKKLRSIDNILKTHGIKAIFCLRLTPMLPIYLFNYILGGFEISNTTFLLSAYGGFPGVMFDVYLGYSASRVGAILQLKENKLISALVIVLGLIILIAMIVWLNKYSQKSFQRLIEEDNAQNSFHVPENTTPTISESTNRLNGLEVKENKEKVEVFSSESTQ